MARKRHKAEEIVAKLRQVDVFTQRKVPTRAECWSDLSNW